uniref:Uncharacterized protein n=1 Tax=Amphimedon queenslandica TaxID=400682 RepID=A0A1X7TFU7_AMPQE
MDTLNEVGIESNYLPNSQLYIIINEQRTKSHNVWRNLVNIYKINAALRKLKEKKWIYRNADDYSIEELCNNVIEVVSNTNCKKCLKKQK